MSMEITLELSSYEFGNIISNNIDAALEHIPQEAMQNALEDSGYQVFTEYADVCDLLDGADVTEAAEWCADNDPDATLSAVLAYCSTGDVLDAMDGGDVAQYVSDNELLEAKELSDFTSEELLAEISQRMAYKDKLAVDLNDARRNADKRAQEKGERISKFFHKVEAELVRPTHERLDQMWVEYNRELDNNNTEEV